MPSISNIAAITAACVAFPCLPGAAAHPGHDTPHSTSEHSDESRTLSRIAFGSCFRERDPAPIWEAVASYSPDAWIMIGDNVYADTEDMAEMRRKYRLLQEVPQFARMQREIPVLATWDDHDYGRNDAGAEYPMKAESQRIFLDVFNEPSGSERRETPGVYDAPVFGPEGSRVQVILLDTRYFRSPLVTAENDLPRAVGIGGRYIPNPDPRATMLGEAQWEWLEAQLRVPADVRIIASSIQVVAEDHRFEKWQNIPHERERLLRLIDATDAAGVVFISGDRHRAELSLFDPSRAEPGSGRNIDAGYPLFDLTSSSLNAGGRGWGNEINRHRIGNQYWEPNFGVIEIDWDQPDPIVSLQLKDVAGETVARYDVALSELRPR